MAQLHYEAYHAPQHNRTPPDAPNGTHGVGRFVNLVGAALSVALVAGVGIWGYRLMVRDVAGVPVIQAMAGPSRISPEDPGGRQAAYQGLAVNNVAAEGGAADAAQTIALAPPPVQLSAEDRAVAALVAQQQPITAPALVGQSTSIQAPAADGQTQTLQFAAPAQQQVAQQQVAQQNVAQPLDLALIPASAPGVSRSLVPRRRPSTRTGTRTGTRPGTGIAIVAPVAPAAPLAEASDPQAEAVLQELVTRLGPVQAIDIDPSTLAPGTRLVQLGAYDSEADAQAQWNMLAARFPAYLEGRGRIIEAASAGGRTFYRLRAHGFADEPEARRFCSIFLAENADCIPVLIR